MRVQRNVTQHNQVHFLFLCAMYRVQVVTGSDKGSGTDSSVFITLVAADGKLSEEVELERSQNMNKFESGATDIFDLSFKSHYDEIVAIRMRSDDSGMGSDWQLNSVTIVDNHLDIEYTFNCKNSWFKKDSKQQEFRSPAIAKQQSYTICVRTSEIENSGTDSNVFLSMYGEKDIIESIPLKNSTEGGNEFERGKTDTFVVKSKVSVGALRKVVVRADGSGLGSDWLLDSEIGRAHV